MVDLRCSSLPLTLTCPPSLDCEIRVEGVCRDASDLGTAVHQVLSAWIARGHPEEEDFIQCSPFVDQDELQALSWWGWKAWQSVKGHFPEPQLEKEFRSVDTGAGILLGGHTDVLDTSQSEARILDFKGGRVDSDHTNQLMGYAWLALQGYPEFERAYCCVLRIRDQVIDGAYYDRAELDRWYAGLVERVRDRTFRPGSHCGYCPRSLSCDANQLMIERALALFSPPDSFGPDAMIESLQRIKIIERACELARATLKAHVIAAGGVMQTGYQALVITEQRQREIDVHAGWDVLSEFVGPDSLKQCLDLSKKKIEPMVKALAQPRGKGKAVKEMYDRLTEAGAITYKTVPKLEIKRLAGLIGGKEDGDGNTAASPAITAGE